MKKLTPKLKAELRRLRRTRFYYLSKQIPERMWRDGEGKYHDMSQMELGHLQACIRLITNDIQSLSSPLISLAAAKRLEVQAEKKRQELRAVFKEKSVE